MATKKKARAAAAQETRAPVETLATKVAGFPIVGIGASAGGLSAFEAFFSGLMNVRDRIPDALRKDALAKAHALSLAGILEPYRTQRITKEGAVVEVWMTATALMNEVGQMYAIATTERSGESAIGRTEGGTP